MSQFLQIHFNITGIIQSTFVSSNWRLPTIFYNKILYVFLISANVIKFLTISTSFTLLTQWHTQKSTNYEPTSYVIFYSPIAASLSSPNVEFSRVSSSQTPSNYVLLKWRILFVSWRNWVSHPQVFPMEPERVFFLKPATVSQTLEAFTVRGRLSNLCSWKGVVNSLKINKFKTPELA
jgi:hypothetical protein